MNLTPILIAFLAFGPITENGNPKSPEAKQEFKQPENQDLDGLVLLKKYCYVCHNPNSASHDEMLAPPLFGIKNHYLKAFPEKGAFIDAMSDFIKNPTEEKALLKGPVNRFGLMPRPAVSDEEIEVIVTYIKDNQLEKPKWFDKHHQGVNEN
ncbi:cytochrome c [Algoriphagus sp. CAU 1675]|uniref:c-type cytochrome n=1 Tax=Algoriphagus sp. CAU 1675 TaxID=3032597 RepID=UPI0023DC33E8|nr:cytochrome c [Algoriphagus sp. CAU 1675]MDF2157326.1 cytochrome c [Algoriphagus sp. CAU 1675]